MARNIGSGAYIYSTYGVTRAPSATTGVRLLYNGTIVATGQLVSPGLFSLGRVSIPTTDPTVVIEVQAWDIRTGATYETASTTAVEEVVVPLAYGNTPVGAMNNFQNMTLSSAGCVLTVVPQAITNFAVYPSEVYAGEPALLSAQAVSDYSLSDVDPLQVTFQVLSGPATISGGILQATAAGIVEVLASQGGMGPCHPEVVPMGFLPAPDVTNTIVVLPARTPPPVVNFSPIPTPLIDGPPVALEASSPDGLGIVFSVASGPGVITNGNQLQVYATNGAPPVVVQAQPVGPASPAGAAFQATLPLLTSQSIIFPSGQEITPTTPIVTPSATASSGLPVAYEVLSGPAQASGWGVAIQGAGEVTVVAMQGGGVPWWGGYVSVYAPAVPVTNSFRVNGAAQTISFPQPSTLTFSPQPVAMVAVASSGLPVAFHVVSGPAVAAPGGITLTGVGDVTIAADQPGGWAGGVLYEAAPTVTVTFKVVPTLQMVSFGYIGSFSYGDPPLAIPASASSGLPVTVTVASGPGVISNGRLTATGVGQVALVATQPGNQVYLPAPPVTNLIQITRGYPQLTWAVIPDQYWPGAPLPLNATVSSGLPLTYAVRAGPGIITNSVLYVTSVGLVEILATQAGNSNWLAASWNNTVRMRPGPQTINFPTPPHLIYGTNLAPLTATASSGLPVTFTVSSGPATVVSNMLSLNGTGLVEVQATQPGDARYTAATPVTTLVRVAALLAIGQDPTAGVRLSVFASQDAPLRIQSSPDLNHWSSVLSGAGAGVGTPVVFQLSPSTVGAGPVYWRAWSP